MSKKAPTGKATQRMHNGLKHVMNRLGLQLDIWRVFMYSFNYFIFASQSEKNE
jgi:hypothetical protein